MLSLAEEFTLLALDDRSGAFLRTKEYALELGTAGSVLMDLALHDRIDSDLQRLVVVDDASTGDDILDPVLRELGRSKDALSVRHWLLQFARVPFLQQRALERLVERGIDCFAR